MNKKIKVRKIDFIIKDTDANNSLVSLLNEEKSLHTKEMVFYFMPTNDNPLF